MKPEFHDLPAARPMSIMPGEMHVVLLSRCPARAVYLVAEGPRQAVVSCVGRVLSLGETAGCLDCLDEEDFGRRALDWLRGELVAAARVA